MKRSFLHLSRISLFLFLPVLYTACKKTDQFYTTLQSIPELASNDDYAYHSAYAVGDTMIVTGRLNPDDGLQITIGDTLATLVSASRISYVAGSGRVIQTDQVRLVITRAMGIGDNQPVTIRSGGFSIQGPAIEIYDPATSYVVKDSLQLSAYYTLPAGASLLYAHNGKGNLYLYAGKNFLYLPKDGQSSILLGAGDLNDDHGAFAITTLYSGGVDPGEENLYFSALTTDTSVAGTTANIYRLCRLDLHSLSLTTLNRTVIPKNNPGLADYQPFEGVVGQAAIPAATGIYPDSKGNVYLALGVAGSSQALYAAALLDATGRVGYLFKQADNSQLYPSGLNTSTVPGTVFQVNGGFFWFRFSPDDGSLYAGFNSLSNSQVIGGMQEYDLQALRLRGSFISQILNVGTTPQPIGDFNHVSVRFTYSSGSQTTCSGFLPLPDDRLITWIYGSLCVMDFGRSRIDYYSPGVLALNGYSPAWTDMINSDGNGYLYILSSDGKTILRTVPQ